MLSDDLFPLVIGLCAIFLMLMLVFAWLAFMVNADINFIKEDLLTCDQFKELIDHTERFYESYYERCEND